MNTYELRNDKKIDSTGIIHNRKSLNEILDFGVLPYLSNKSWNELYSDLGPKSAKIYQVGVGHENIEGFPRGAYPYGLLIVITYNGRSDFSDCQIYITDGTGEKTISERGVYIRMRTSSWLKLSGTIVLNN